MKKVFFFFLLFAAAFSSSSFISLTDQHTIPASNSLSNAAGVSFHVEGSETFSTIYTLCNGDEVYFEQITYTYDVHGVNNNNMSMAQGKETWTGTGVSLVTGEIYTLNDSERFNEKVPIENGAAVFHNRVNGVLTGDQGSADNYIIKSHFTVNANGYVTADHGSMTSDCQ